MGLRIGLVMGAVVALHPAPAAADAATPGASPPRASSSPGPASASSAAQRKSATPAGEPTARTGTARSSSSLATLSEEASVERASLHYDGGRYLECAQQFDKLLEPSSASRLREPELIEKARVYRAACLLGLGEAKDADEELEAAIRANPQMGAPDVLVFPQIFIDRFLAVRDRLMSEIELNERREVEKAEADAAKVAERTEAERRRLGELEYLASQEVIVRERSRWIAAIPFGAGQFQNGDDGLGWFFLTSEALLGATMIGALVADSVLQEQRYESNRALSGQAFYDAQMTAYYVLVGSSYAFLGLAGVGIAEAQASYVYETREVRSRPLPERLRDKKTASVQVAPSPLLLREGGGLGIVGRF